MIISIPNYYKCMKRMKRILLILNVELICVFASTISAQKFAFINLEYILNKIPAYEMMNEQLGQLSKKWQAEIETFQQETENVKKSYENELAFLSAEMQLKRKEDILKKEQGVQEIKRKYFGADGEFYKRRDQLLKPILDEIYETVETIAKDKEFHAVFDRSSSSIIVIYFSPQIDISNEVLLKLGYK